MVLPLLIYISLFWIICVIVFKNVLHVEKKLNIIEKIMCNGEECTLKEEEFNASMEIIVSALKERGFDPYSQLYGYLEEGKSEYITRHRNARELIQKLDKKQIRQYVIKLK